MVGMTRPVPAALRPQYEAAAVSTSSEPQRQPPVGETTPAPPAVEGVHLILVSLVPVEAVLTSQNSEVVTGTRASVPQLQAAAGLDVPATLAVGQVMVGMTRPVPAALRPQYEAAAVSTSSEPQRQPPVGETTPAPPAVEGVHLILVSLVPVEAVLTSQNSEVVIGTRVSVPQLQAAAGLDLPSTLAVGQVMVGMTRPVPAALRPQYEPAAVS